MSYSTGSSTTPPAGQPQQQHQQLQHANNNNHQISNNWRKRGQRLRAALIEQDDAQQQFSLSDDCPIDRYYQVADKVLDQFLHHPIDTRDELLEAYMVGHRLVQFLSNILPTHGDYFVETTSTARDRSQEQLVRVLQYLDQMAVLIDKQEHEDYIRSVLGHAAAAPQQPNPDGENSDALHSESTQSWNNTTITSADPQKNAAHANKTTAAATATTTQQRQQHDVRKKQQQHRQLEQPNVVDESDYLMDQTASQNQSHDSSVRSIAKNWPPGGRGGGRQPPQSQQQPQQQQRTSSPETVKLQFRPMTKLQKLAAAQAELSPAKQNQNTLTSSSRSGHESNENVNPKAASLWEDTYARSHHHRKSPRSSPTMSTSQKTTTATSSSNSKTKESALIQRPAPPTHGAAADDDDLSVGSSQFTDGPRTVSADEKPKGEHRQQTKKKTKEEEELDDSFPVLTTHRSTAATEGWDYFAEEIQNMSTHELEVSQESSTFSSGSKNDEPLAAAPTLNASTESATQPLLPYEPSVDMSTATSGSNDTPSLPHSNVIPGSRQQKQPMSPFDKAAEVSFESVEFETSARSSRAFINTSTEMRPHPRLPRVHVVTPTTDDGKKLSTSRNQQQSSRDGTNSGDDKKALDDDSFGAMAAPAFVSPTVLQQNARVHRGTSYSASALDWSVDDGSQTTAPGTKRTSSNPARRSRAVDDDFCGNKDFSSAMHSSRSRSPSVRSPSPGTWEQAWLNQSTTSVTHNKSSSVPQDWYNTELVGSEPKSDPFSRDMSFWLDTKAAQREAPVLREEISPFMIESKVEQQQLKKSLHQSIGDTATTRSCSTATQDNEARNNSTAMTPPVHSAAAVSPEQFDNSLLDAKLGNASHSYYRGMLEDDMNLSREQHRHFNRMLCGKREGSSSSNNNNNSHKERSPNEHWDTEDDTSSLQLLKPTRGLGHFRNCVRCLLD